uniref:Uncharacterized protein n=1 Tax=Solanum lycopersicum TaxID=4081 RepID=A0A3Q7EV10_SOLLC
MQPLVLYEWFSRRESSKFEHFQVKTVLLKVGVTTAQLPVAECIFILYEKKKLNQVEKKGKGIKPWRKRRDPFHWECFCHASPPNICCAQT